MPTKSISYPLQDSNAWDSESHTGCSATESSERASICHTNPVTYWKYVLLQDMLTSAHFYRVGSWARANAGSYLTTYPSAMTYDFLAHYPTHSRAWLRTIGISVFGVEANDTRSTTRRNPRAACLLALWTGWSG